MQWGLGGFGLLVLTVLSGVNDLKVEHQIECSAARGNTQGDAAVPSPNMKPRG